MLKRGYIILIGGGILLMAGVILSIFSVGSFANQFLQENIVLSQAIVRPSESLDAVLQVNGTSSSVSVALHPEQESTNVTRRETVRDPNGKIIHTNEFLKDFVTTFKPNMTGEYTLLVSNLGSEAMKVDGIFGFLPLVGGGNDLDNLNSLSMIITGVILFILGIVTLIASIIFIILDRRKEKRRPSLTR
jgi:hypothetical protein